MDSNTQQFDNLDQLSTQQKEIVNKFHDLFYSDSGPRFKDEKTFNFYIDLFSENMIHFMAIETINYFNLLTKS